MTADLPFALVALVLAASLVAGSLACRLGGTSGRQHPLVNNNVGAPLDTTSHASHRGEFDEHHTA